MYDKDYGIINFLLNNAGILSHNIAYLQDVSVALPAAKGIVQIINSKNTVVDTERIAGIVM